MDIEQGRVEKLPMLRRLLRLQITITFNIDFYDKSITFSL